MPFQLQGSESGTFQLDITSKGSLYIASLNLLRASTVTSTATQIIIKFFKTDYDTNEKVCYHTITEAKISKVLKFFSASKFGDSKTLYSEENGEIKYLRLRQIRHRKQRGAIKQDSEEKAAMLKISKISFFVSTSNYPEFLTDKSLQKPKSI